GKPTQIIDPNGNSELFDYDTRGLLTSKTDANGKVWTYEYDNSTWKITKETPPVGNPIIYTYDKYGLDVTKIQGDMKTLTQYDQLGRIVKEVSYAGNVVSSIIRHVYNPTNNSYFKSFPCKVEGQCTKGTLTFYNVFGDETAKYIDVEETYQPSTELDQQTTNVKKTYTAGLRTKTFGDTVYTNYLANGVTDKEGNDLLYANTLSSPDGGVIRLDADVMPDGKVFSFSQNGLTRSYAYDATFLNRKLTETNPEIGVKSFAYYGDGKLNTE
ncbi:MAG: hypothetical protein O2809_09890, partial [Proteobacteria bacterium]|nr:hypothetical protein [Pseudomonadota bacterium]